MVANNSGREARRLSETFPGRIGHLYTPNGVRGPFAEFPYVGEGGQFGDTAKSRVWDARPFLAMCARFAVAEQRPEWVAVPDVPFDAEGTVRAWYHWIPTMRTFGLPLAFVVQDGMRAGDVPGEATAIFVGGSTAWKQDSARYWCEHFPRVHIGRVNGERDLWRYHRAGAESCDGSGWFRGSRRQLDGLWYYLADSSGLDDASHGPMQARLFPLGAIV